MSRACSAAYGGHPIRVTADDLSIALYVTEDLTGVAVQILFRWLRPRRSGYLTSR